LEDPGVDERMLLKWTFEKWDEGRDWIDLDQDRNRWVGGFILMDFGFHKMREIS
jgi:hypothetical protein